MDKQGLIQEQLQEHQSIHNGAKALLKLALVLTCGFYLMFGFNLYLGDPLTWAHYFDNNLSAAGFIFMALLVVGLAVFLAWVKHHAYIYFGLFGQIGFIFAVLFGFAIFAELFTASANQDAKAKIHLENNAAYQATIQATSGGATATGSPALALQIANAQQVYERCLKKLEAGKEKHCNGDKGKLDALKASESRLLDKQEQASTEAVALNHKRQDELKADAYNPVIVAVAKMITPAGASWMDYVKPALVWVMLFVSFCFEVLHRFLSTSIEKSGQSVKGLKMELGKYEQPSDYADDYQTEPHKQPVGFNHTATANAPYPVRFKYQEQEPINKQPMGFIHPDKPARRKTNATPVANEMQNATPDTSTWNAELNKMGVACPADDLMNQSADKAQIERIIRRAQTDNSGTDMRVETSPNTDTPHAPPARVVRVGTDEALRVATDAEAGSEVHCPQCGTVFKKRNKQHRFCKKECRYTWHNERDPKKQAFLKAKSIKA